MSAPREEETAAVHQDEVVLSVARKAISRATALREEAKEGFSVSSVEDLATNPLSALSKVFNL